MPVRILLSLLLVVLIGGCERSETEKTSPAGVAEDLLGQSISLQDFITAKPAPVLSARSFIELEFKRPMVPPHLVGISLGTGPVTLEPALTTQAEWVTTSLLRLRPAEPLPAGKEFRGTLSGTRAFGTGLQVDDFTFKFQVAQRELLEVTGDFVPVQGAVNQARLELELRFSEKVNPELLSQEIRLQDRSTRLRFQLSADGEGRRVRLVSEPCERQTQARRIDLRIPGDYTIHHSTYEQSYLLAAKGDFRVTGQGEQSDPHSTERTWELRFSDPVATGQDLSGFVTVEPAIPFQVTVRGRQLRVRGAFVPGTDYQLRVTAGLPSAYGTRLNQEYIKQIYFANAKPMAEWVGEGIYLPLENQGKVQFRTRNLGKIRVTVQEVLPQNLVFFLQNNDLRSQEQGEDDGKDYWWGGSLNDVERTARPVYTSEITLTNAPRNAWHKVQLDLSDKLRTQAGAAYVVELNFDQSALLGPCTDQRDNQQENDLFYPDESYYGNPCNPGYYYGRGTQQRLFIVSSIGLTAKKSAEGVHVWATDIATAQPISGLKLELLNRVNESLRNQTTNRDGYALFSDSGSAQAFAVRGVGKRGFALLKLSGSNWETSRFETDGTRTFGKELRFFGYTDRGVYRPGDTVHLAGLIRSGNNAPPAHLPVQIEIRDPQGAVHSEYTASTHATGMLALDIPTRLSDPTGTWSAVVRTAGQTWFHSLRVEMVKPNRLKNDMELPQQLNAADRQIRTRLQSRYLFGTPAAGLRARVQMTILPRTREFRRYPDFVFRNPLRVFDEYRTPVWEGNLDEAGTAPISTPIPDLKQTPQAAMVRFQATVHEKGGDFTESWHSVPVDPFPAWVGLKFQDNWYSVRTGDTLRIPVISVDSSGRALEGRKLRVRVYQNKRYSWWEGTRRDRWDFRLQEQTYLVHESEIRSAQIPVEFRWVPEEEAQLFIEVDDVQGGHSAGQYVYASQWGYGSGRVKIPEASHLALQTDRTSYEAGQKLQVFFQAPENARALVSLEQNGKVLDSRWIQTHAGQNRVEFATSATMVPNVYAVVSLILPHAQAGGERPLRLYGIQSVAIENPDNRLKLALHSPAEVRPGESFQVEVRNSSKEEASYTLAVVDEGLLDLTSFRTPDPWRFFFAKMALNLESLDNLDEVIGALQPDMDAYLSVGGDEEVAQRRGHPKVQRFKAVALSSGIRNVAAGKTDRVTFRMPHYVGSVRVMLVGAAARGFVSADTVMAVRQPLMVLPTLPRVLRPGDRFDIPVSVFAMDAKVKKAAVQLELPPELIAAGPLRQDVTFSAPGEKDVRFAVRVADKLGAARIAIQVTGAGEQVRSETEVPIMSPGSYITDVTDTLVPLGDSLLLAVEPFGIAGTHKATLVLSSMPTLRLDERMSYLIRYPYGCLEQTVSSIFPQLYLENLQELNAQQKKEISANIQAGLERLRTFALPKGFMYWPGSGFAGNRQVDPWSTSYTGHFLLEAKRLGYAIPQSLLDSWLAWEKEQAGNVRSVNHRYQTYRLYLLAVAGQAQMGAMNLLRENHLNNLDPLSRQLLAAAYHAAGQNTVAREILSGATGNTVTYREMAGTYGSSLRDQALGAWILLGMGETQDAQRAYQTLGEEFRRHSWWSTQESAFTLLAFSALAKKSSGSDIEVEWNVAGQKKHKQVVGENPQRISLTAQGRTQVQIRPLNGVVFAELQVEGIPLTDRIQTASKGLRMQRLFYDADGLPMSVEQIRQSTPFWTVFRVQNQETRRIDGLALSSLFPAGFEIVNERLSQDAGPAWTRNLRRKSADYTDIRDDRVNWFFSLEGGETADFAVQVHPAYSGSFRWPGVVLEAMYHPEYYARLEGGNVEVR